jgi:hypothetical protein
MAAMSIAHGSRSCAGGAPGGGHGGGLGIMGMAMPDGELDRDIGAGEPEIGRELRLASLISSGFRGPAMAVSSA